MNEQPEHSSDVPVADRLLDVRGLKCPLPILRSKKALAEMASGAVLEIQATDRAAGDDFAAFARQTGHQLLHTAEAEGGVSVFYLRRK